MSKNKLDIDSNTHYQVKKNPTRKDFSKIKGI